MFFYINKTNFFIIPDGKTVENIYSELFSRMPDIFISSNEKNKVIYEIKKQLEIQCEKFI